MKKVLWQTLLYGNESRDHHVKYDIPHKGTNQYYAAMQILVSPYLEVRRYNDNLNYLRNNVIFDLLTFVEEMFGHL